ncbi:uncharacterized protein LOC119299422 [Triticum dicoccoides]|uniref:uncharacterized protein LOC119299422 n=1 Tax=Triticum dicoccoides TaxID=85692 RepID=UPI00189062FE|nr:uncharacterized protein LOC119299422 [Triticum dicoccoides]
MPLTNQQICFLNGSPDEVIRSLFYNKNNDSLITVSVHGSANFSALRCRTTRIEYIRRGKSDAGFPLFETESSRWPGFVVFDDVNGKVPTYSAQDRLVKLQQIWSCCFHADEGRRTNLRMCRCLCKGSFCLVRHSIRRCNVVFAWVGFYLSYGHCCLMLFSERVLSVLPSLLFVVLLCVLPLGDFFLYFFFAFFGHGRVVAPAILVASLLWPGCMDVCFIYKAG